jgi:HEAT repeat protein
MAFYDLPKEERKKLSEKIHKDIREALLNENPGRIIAYFADEDTYIRKNAYLATGRIFNASTGLHKKIIQVLEKLAQDADPKVRQTAVNTAGEVGMKQFGIVEHFFDKGLFDEHHSVRNAVIGSVKKMGEKNPAPVLSWARKYLHHSGKEVRREICHGIELRGRKHPEDILPLLKELQHDKTARVRNTLVHVLGQIAYKKGCLEKVIAHLKTWENQEVVMKALEEIIDVHDRYRNFAALSQNEAKEYIETHF